MEKLFVYGTLGPERPNEHILKNIGGTWKNGYVWGELFKEGWGAEVGFPGIRLENKVEKVEGYVFYSNKLEDSWGELDKFEGKAYQRIKTKVILKDTEEEIEAYIYSLK
ncbi:gamma-glutamylcyclotransferase family protein [Tenacibaculum aiptasiae]|uniref:gamma-glutamylcyclotransferase family protein n=1 Tax=Tenacibaculum aiptasiae TaxID=426481 RepID=UPI00232F9829|nr:gamma-glutamylcyclotransferase family protein [Tenacibaculum aiptasiae]